MKKGLKITGTILGGVFVLGMCSAILSGNDEGPGTKSEPKQVTQQQPTTKEAAPAPEPPKEEPKETTFAFGTEVPFESGLNIKVTGVRETTERNQFADPTKHVMVISLEVANTTGAEVTVTANDLNIQDSTGFQGTTYPGGDQIVTIAPNGKARMEFHYGVDGEGPYKVLAGEAIWQ